MNLVLSGLKAGCELSSNVDILTLNETKDL